MLPEVVPTFNFAIFSPDRAGSSALASALNSRPEVHVHLNPLHDSDTVRRKEGIAYFGEEAMDRYSDPESFWCPQVSPRGAGNIRRFLFHRIWDRPTAAETHIGVRISYSQAKNTDMVDILAEAETRGDFCTLHVDRNPVMSFVSREQARQSGQAGRHVGTTDPHPYVRPVEIHIESLLEYIHFYEQTKYRLGQMLRDVLWIPYETLLAHPRRVLRMVARFLELPAKNTQATFVRQKHKDLPRRVTNWVEVSSTRHKDVLRYLQQPWI